MILHMVYCHHHLVCCDASAKFWVYHKWLQLLLGIKITTIYPVPGPRSGPYPKQQGLAHHRAATEHFRQLLLACGHQGWVGWYHLGTWEEFDTIINYMMINVYLL